MNNWLHVAVGRFVGVVVNTQVVLVVIADARLVEDAQYLVQTVVHLSVQTRYLNDDAVVVQAVDELIGNTSCDGFVVVAEHFVTYVNDGFLNLADRMSQQIDGYHGQGVPVGAVCNNVLRVLVVYAQVLPEAQRLGGKPRLLQLNQQ